mmetsp:Transcript_1439/g.5774  ORF Transcript_1439/g.5774 Transcript_1439/m.5774 type:complete len:215 (-) Transcript_1439:843-1487(-)
MHQPWLCSHSEVILPQGHRDPWHSSCQCRSLLPCGQPIDRTSNGDVHVSPHLLSQHARQQKCGSGKLDQATLLPWYFPASSRTLWHSPHTFRQPPLRLSHMSLGQYSRILCMAATCCHDRCNDRTPPSVECTLAAPGVQPPAHDRASPVRLTGPLARSPPHRRPLLGSRRQHSAPSTRAPPSWRHGPSPRDQRAQRLATATPLGDKDELLVHPS